ncbi:GTP cyclohydrolase I FolE [candidate division LCP-89 bacterium B3_LCP]|uniref:GTP cyclohydrolase 1 n=1 Tax=candidate division LCP-89 bacterium B3_LCP TaxID=2012998 RepID=A0A532UY73_UNCL8|nr:MAG: GTP cyclohydrolase I FolE [candidate division LCP-89 bacterium B3_LCP]
MAIDRQRIISAVRELILAIGEDPEREGLQRTPERVAEMYEEIFSGIGRDVDPEIAIFTTKNQDEMILLRDVPFHSMCEHHLLPFYGTVSIAYIPDNNRITGFSSLARVVDMVANRPQLQERMTTDIADALMRVLKPLGVFVIIRAQHLCMTMRGVKKTGARTVTSSMRGIMRKQATRLEALSLMGEKNVS